MNAGILPLPMQYATPPRAIGGGLARPVQMPGGCGADNTPDWTRPNWPVVQDSLYGTIRAFSWVYGSRITAVAITAGSYVGSAITLNGLLLSVPFNSTAGLVFNSNNNTVYLVGTFAGIGSFQNCVLLNDGRIFLIPRVSTSARIIDIQNNIVTTPGGVFPGGTPYSGGCLIDGGRRIYLAPGYRTAATIYDLASETLSTPSGSFNLTITGGGLEGLNTNGQTATSGAFLLPDGRVFMAPGNDTVTIYDPRRNSLFRSSLGLGRDAGNNQNRYSGAVLLPGGDDVALMPQGASAGGMAIYNWRRDTVRITGATAVTGYYGGQMAPDGSILLNPNSATAIRYYRHDMEAFVTLPGTWSGTFTIAGMHVAPDGRLVLMPRGNAAVLTYGQRYSASFDPNVPLSPFFNHR